MFSLIYGTLYPTLQNFKIQSLLKFQFELESLHIPSKASVTSSIKSGAHSLAKKQSHRRLSQLPHVTLYQIVAEEFLCMFLSKILYLQIIHHIGNLLSFAETLLKLFYSEAAKVTRNGQSYPRWRYYKIFQLRWKRCFLEHRLHLRLGIYVPALQLFNYCFPFKGRFGIPTAISTAISNDIRVWSLNHSKAPTLK